jgi:hypothetical protein
MRRFALAAAVLAYGLVLSAGSPARADDLPSPTVVYNYGDTVCIAFNCSIGPTTASIYLVSETNPPTFTAIEDQSIVQVGATDSYCARFPADFANGPGFYVINIHNGSHKCGTILLDLRRAGQMWAERQDVQRIEQGLFTRLYDRDTNRPTKPETPAQRQRENLNRGFDKQK